MTRPTAPVVIAGAGPNGLMLARELALAGITPVVLDTLPGPSSEPKANGLVGQVIRTLDMRGLYRAFTGDDDPPQPTYGWIYSGMPLNFLGLENNPMYAMLLPQPRLVRLLEKQVRGLGVDLRWGHELIGQRADDNGITLTVSAPGGDYELAADYLVGADGGRSFVRKNAGIAFPGSTAATVARLAHVHVPDTLRGVRGGLDIPGFGAIPAGHNRFDAGMVMVVEFEPGHPFVGTMEFGTARETGQMSVAELRESLARVLGVDVAVEEPRGPGPHALRRIDGQNSRQAERYRDGRILLLGDAAHVHSAMGGPGLNLGLQDAVNLGWKLAAQLNGWAPAGLLDSYESERQPVGERVMMQSKAQTALMAPGPEVDALRTLFGELVRKQEVAQHLAGLLAGSDIGYDVGDDHRLSGRLFPDLELDDGRRVADLLHEARPILLDFTGDLILSHSRVDVVSAVMTDPPAAALLIRPDGYVAWATDALHADAEDQLRAAISRWFG